MEQATFLQNNLASDDNPDLSSSTFSSNSSSKKERHLECSNGVESAHQRLNDFIDKTLSQEPLRSKDDISKIAEDYFKQLNDETEIVLALNKLGGLQYYRPCIPREIAITLPGMFFKMDNELILIAALRASNRLSCVDDYSDDVKRLSDHHEPIVRQEALYAMGSGSNPDFHRILIHALKNEQTDLKRSASSSLINFSDKEATIQALRPCLNDVDSEIRENAVSVIGCFAFISDDLELKHELQKELVLRLFDDNHCVYERTVKLIWQFAGYSDPIIPELLNALAAKTLLAKGEYKIECAQALLRTGSRRYASLLNSMLLDPHRDDSFKLAMINAIRREDRQLFAPALELLSQDVSSCERLLKLVHELLR